MATEFNTQIGNGKYRLQFETDNEAHYLLMQSAARQCIDHAHMTNADLIRSMSDQGLALCLYEIGYVGGWYSKKDALEWLQQPAEETER